VVHPSRRAHPRMTAALAAFFYDFFKSPVDLPWSGSSS
jgi:hypothetical protein